MTGPRRYTANDHLAVRDRFPIEVAVGSLGNLGGAGLGRGALHPDPERAARGQRLPSTMPDPKRPGVLPPSGVTHPVLLEDGDSGSPNESVYLVR